MVRRMRRGRLSLIARNPRHRCRRSRIVAGSRRLEADEAASKRGLARAGFADKADALPGPDLERNAFQRLNRRPRRPAKVLTTARRRDERLRWPVASSGRAALHGRARGCAAHAFRLRSRVRRMQAVKRPGASSASGGLAARHSSRGPVAAVGESCSGRPRRPARGTEPRIAISRGTRLSAGGSESRRPKRIGMERIALRQRAASPTSMHRSGVENVDALAGGEGEPEIVGDEDKAHPARFAGRASGA